MANTPTMSPEDSRKFFDQLPSHKQESLLAIDHNEANEMNEQFKDARTQRDSAQKVITEQEQVRDSAQKVLDEISGNNEIFKPNMTDEDIETMKNIQANNPQLFEKIWSRLEYGPDYIQIHLPNSGKIQIDRQDLGEMDWSTAQVKSGELGKTQMKRGEYEELIDCLGLEEIRSIFGFSPNDYWSSTEYSSTNAWCQDFGDGDQGSSSNSNTHCVRCICRV